LTPSALERIQDPGDWLRREIETAMETGRNVVPLMLEGFDFGTPSVAERLTGTLAPLKRYNGLPVVASYFEAAMQRLREKHLSVAVDSVVHPPSPIAAEAARQQQAVAADAPTVEERTLTAEQWFERGWEATDLSEKVRCFTEVLRLNPAHVQAYIGRGQAHFRIGEQDAGLADYETAQNLDPNNGFLFWSRAIVRREAGDLTGALADIADAIRIQPQDHHNYSTRGHIRNEMGDVDNAIDDYTEASHLNATSGAALFFRGDAKESQGDIDGALSDYTDAIARQPDDPGSYAPYAARADILADRRELERALADYDQALRLRPDGIAGIYFRRRAEIRAELKDRNGAIEDYERYLRLADRSSDLYDDVQERLRVLRAS
jgi:tetratricopeptide (TPR) repeat protein